MTKRWKTEYRKDHSTSRPCVVSLHGPGIRLKLAVDRRTCVELVAMVSTIVHANFEADPAPESAPVSVLPSSVDLSNDDQHELNHRNAPDALRAFYKTLCDDLLSDAQLALDDERRRRADAS